MKYNRIPIFEEKTSKTHMEFRQFVNCPMHGEKVSINRCRKCPKCGIVLADIVKCKHGEEVEYVTPYNLDL